MTRKSMTCVRTPTTRNSRETTLRRASHAEIACSVASSAATIVMERRVQTTPSTIDVVITKECIKMWNINLAEWQHKDSFEGTQTRSFQQFLKLFWRLR